MYWRLLFCCRYIIVTFMTIVNSINTNYHKIGDINDKLYSVLADFKGKG